MTKALLVYPSHSNIREEVDRYEDGGLDVAAYPARTTTGTEHQDINCWNTEADRAEAAGFPVGKTICKRCEFRETCLASGYLGQIIDTEKADITLATHARLEHTGFAELSDGRGFVSIHEDATQLLNPTSELQFEDLRQVRDHVELLLRDPMWLNWYGDEQATGDAEQEKQTLRRQRILTTNHALADLLEDLQAAMESATETIPWMPPYEYTLPVGYESFLWWTSKILKLHVRGTPWKFLLPALAGELKRCTILVSKVHVAGMKQGTTRLIKTVVGVRENHPPPGTNTWFGDATMTVERLEGILGRTVHDATPQGRIPEKKFAYQYVRDINRRTSLSMTISLLRGILAKQPCYQRVGVITHQPQLVAIDRLEDVFRKRIVKSTYFGSGDERSSNAWYRECDVILVMGTPRVPPQAIKQYLVQVGEQDVACSEPTWGDVRWQAHTHKGELKTFSGRGYQDERWRNAYRDRVGAALVQAIGRGRIVLENGCDVIVFSNEPCGVMVLDDETPRINDSAMQAWEYIRQLTMEKPNKYSIGKTIVSTQDIAQHLSLSAPRTRELLRHLESFHLVHRAGLRSGWLLGPQEQSSQSQPRTESMHAHCH